MLAKAAVTIVALYVLLVFVAWLGQRRLIYVPNPTRYAPAAAGLAQADERELATPDGARLVTWRIGAKPGQPTILYFHGNGGGLVNRAARAARYAALGYGILMMSYRGYSGSTGSPSEAANLADAKLAYDTLIAEGIKSQDIVIYGESLGTGVAVQVAAENPALALILDAPYTSMADMAQRRFPILPVRPLLADRYESTRFIGQVRMPVLVLHGADDELIPVAMGRAIFALANEPKKLAIFEQGHHTDLDQHGAVEAVSGWIATLLRPK